MRRRRCSFALFLAAAAAAAPLLGADAAHASAPESAASPLPAVTAPAADDTDTAFGRAQASTKGLWPPANPAASAPDLYKARRDAAAAARPRPRVPLAAPFNRLGFQVGAARPFGPLADANGERPWSVLGLTYRLQSPGKRALFQPDLYMDFGDNAGDTRRGSSFFESGQGRRFWGIGTSVRSVAYLLRGSAAAYAGAGAGIYRLESSRRTEIYNAVDSSVDIRPTGMGFRPGGKLFAGMTHRSGVYLETAWHDAGSLNGRRYGGLVWSLGFRR